MSGETKETCFDEFVAAREQFEKLMGELRSDSARILEHGEVESLIAREGYELLRRLMQGYLDQRAAAEARCEVVTGADGAAALPSQKPIAGDGVRRSDGQAPGVQRSPAEECFPVGCCAESAAEPILPRGATQGRVGSGQGLV